jgi:hypothetical protein
MRRAKKFSCWVGEVQLRLCVPLVGGLGNQLFMVAYGLMHQICDEADVQFLVPASGFGNTNHGHNVLEEMVLGVSVRFASEGILETWGAKAQRFSSRKGLGVLIEKLFSTIHLNEGVPIDARLSSTQESPRTCFRDSGYFQDPIYLEKLQARGVMQNILPIRPSSWFGEVQAMISECSGIGVHVRRGDFERPGSPGVLSVPYYREALRTVSNLGGEGKVFIFSDSINSVKEEFAELQSEFEIEFVSPPRESSPVESLSLLSQFSNLVISNSTFSWWSAATGRQKNIVVSPQTWKRNHDQMDKLNLIHWRAQQSTWR